MRNEINLAIRILCLMAAEYDRGLPIPFIAEKFCVECRTVILGLACTYDEGFLDFFEPLKASACVKEMLESYHRFHSRLKDLKVGASVLVELNGVLFKDTVESVEEEEIRVLHTEENLPTEVVIAVDKHQIVEVL
jgi:hypothetical protein